MTALEQAVSEATERLRTASATPRLDAEVLAAHLLQRPRSWLIAHPDAMLDETAYQVMIKQRAAGKPVAYLVGHKEFYGREFEVTPAVLVPRPETELLVEQAVAVLQPGDVVIDIGTGSGCVAISVAHIHRGSVMATDRSREALAVAMRNAVRHHTAVNFHLTDLLPDDLPVAAKCVVCANLPYVADQQYRGSLRHEPAIALRAGNDGLTAYRRLFGELRRRRWQPRELLVEADPRQFAALQKMAGTADITTYQDASERLRVLRVSQSVPSSAP